MPESGDNKTSDSQPNSYYTKFVHLIQLFHPEYSAIQVENISMFEENMGRMAIEHSVSDVSGDKHTPSQLVNLAKSAYMKADVAAIKALNDELSSGSDVVMESPVLFYDCFKMLRAAHIFCPIYGISPKHHGAIMATLVIYIYVMLRGSIAFSAEETFFYINSFLYGELFEIDGLKDVSHNPRYNSKAMLGSLSRIQYMQQKVINTVYLPCDTCVLNLKTLGRPFVSVFCKHDKTYMNPSFIPSVLIYPHNRNNDNILQFIFVDFRKEMLDNSTSISENYKIARGKRKNLGPGTIIQVKVPEISYNLIMMPDYVNCALSKYSPIVDSPILILPYIFFNINDRESWINIIEQMPLFEKCILNIANYMQEKHKFLSDKDSAFSFYVENQLKIDDAYAADHYKYEKYFTAYLMSNISKFSKEKEIRVIDISGHAMRFFAPGNKFVFDCQEPYSYAQDFIAGQEQEEVIDRNTKCIIVFYPNSIEHSIMDKRIFRIHDFHFYGIIGSERINDGYNKNSRTLNAIIYYRNSVVLPYFIGSMLSNLHLHRVMKSGISEIVGISGEALSCIRSNDFNGNPKAFTLDTMDKN